LLLLLKFSGLARQFAIQHFSLRMIHVMRSSESNQKLSIGVPPLPPKLHYYDDFSDSYQLLFMPEENDIWALRYDERNISLDFSYYDPSLRKILKSWLANILCRLSPCTCHKYFDGIQQISADRLSELTALKPTDLRAFWSAHRADGLSAKASYSLKSFLKFLCVTNVGNWVGEWLGILDDLPAPPRDKYASVRSGDVFLDAAEEAALVQEIDSVALSAQKDPTAISFDTLRSICVLLCSYQFAMRPKQIAMLQLSQVRIWRETEAGIAAVHLRFTMIKQRSASRVLPLVRRVKREWSSLFMEFVARAQSQGLASTGKLFQLNPSQISSLIRQTTARILGHERSATELRHTAAQRLVDAGATEEELAAFMGHSHLDTGLVYFRSSRSQAERVNSAIGISPVYQHVVQIAHQRFINPEELSRLKGDQQIGGVPHGIPIAGIGGCSSGQPACPYNPVIACYTCRKFMPVNDRSVHENVLSDFRSVVRLFERSSRGEPSSPAFLQLRTTLTAIESVIEELEA
jgi:integrase